MKFRFLLWCNAFVFAAYLVGHLFDICIIVPNWRAGSLEDLKAFQDFFHRTNPMDFFRVIMPISTALSILCFIVFFRKGNPMLALLTISLLIDIGIDLVTYHYFVPINKYLFVDQGGALDQERVQSYVSTWVKADFLRVALITIGFYASLRALQLSLARP